MADFVLIVCIRPFLSPTMVVEQAAVLAEVPDSEVDRAIHQSSVLQSLPESPESFGRHIDLLQSTGAEISQTTELTYPPHKVLPTGLDVRVVIDRESHLDAERPLAVKGPPEKHLF